MTVREEDVSQLTSMGFPEREARTALLRASGNLEGSIHYLLSGNSDASVHSETAGMNIIRGSTNQYSYGSDGRSACTCIALAAADDILLANIGNQNEERWSSIVTSQVLDRCIEEGVSRYRILRQRPSTSGAVVEHLSAEEVLQLDGEGAASHKKNRLFGIRINKGIGLRQGAISREFDHPLGLKAVLQGLISDIRLEGQHQQPTIQQDERTNTESHPIVSQSHPSPMICILVTKTPETVLVCLQLSEDGDSSSSSNNANHHKQFWLVDSHPRPQMGVETSYAKPHDTMEALLESLVQIFPFTDLGPDVPPMMADMYNMFDLYPLARREED